VAASSRRSIATASQKSLRWSRHLPLGVRHNFKGLKMRISGLGRQVIARAGGTVVLTPGAEIYGALERGVIDACEWIAPHDDMKLGLHKTARYHYYPGWHEPGTTTEFGFNKKAYEALPVDLRRMLDLEAVAEDAEEALHDLRPRLGVELLRQLHRALHVGEEDGDLLALALDRGQRIESQGSSS
jgi:TRAP-type mannitol/chloroaromatic compound transport system substrate-binding protein